MEDENRTAFVRIRELQSVRMSNGRKIIEIEKQVRKLLGRPQIEEDIIEENNKEMN